MPVSEVATASVQLTIEIAETALRDFFREKPFLFFGTGMSCALDMRFGMPALRDVLLSRVLDEDLSDEQRQEWAEVAASLQDGQDLETALGTVNDQGLLTVVTKLTGAFIADVDREYAYRFAQGQNTWPASSLLKRLVDTLPDGDRILHALTPNYDMLFEYACESASIPYTCGFVGGIERVVDWESTEQQLTVRERTTYGLRRSEMVYKTKKHVRVYKVHGSLNYFFHRGKVVEVDSWMWNPPDFASRVMITPGLAKYEMLQQYRLELLRSADNAIERASHFLFLGYGFNDKHLEEYIKRKLITQGSRGLIITRDSNARIEELLAASDNLWLVCKSEDAASDGTRIYNKNYDGWLELPNMKLWNIADFTNYIIGT